MTLLLFKITTILIPVAALLMGIYTIIKNPRARVNRLWFVFNLFVAIWGTGLSLLLFAGNIRQALLYGVILTVGSSFLPTLLLHFVASFLFVEERVKSLIRIGYVLSTVLMIATLFPPLMIYGAGPVFNFNFWVGAGPLYIPFFIFFCIYVIISVYLLVMGYRSKDGLAKKQVLYVLVAVLIGFIGGSTNFFPHIIGIYPFGSFVTFLYTILVTYGIFIKK